MTQRIGTARTILALVISLGAASLIWFVHAPWTAWSIPVVWLAAYLLGTSEGRGSR